MVRVASPKLPTTTSTSQMIGWGIFGEIIVRSHVSTLIPAPITFLPLYPTDASSLREKRSQAGQVSSSYDQRVTNLKKPISPQSLAYPPRLKQAVILTEVTAGAPLG